MGEGKVTFVKLRRELSSRGSRGVMRLNRFMSTPRKTRGTRAQNITQKRCGHTGSEVSMKVDITEKSASEKFAGRTISLLQEK